MPSIAFNCFGWSISRVYRKQYCLVCELLLQDWAECLMGYFCDQSRDSEVPKHTLDSTISTFVGSVRFAGSVYRRR